MQRLTGNQAYDLMEAYGSIYEPQNITEEQIIEDFNERINQLVEEGYDLSAYNYDDLYEFYITEGIGQLLMKAGKGIMSATGRGAKSVWSGYSKPIRGGGIKRVPGAAGALTSIGTRAVHAGLKFGIPLYVVNALTGGAVEKIGKHGLNQLQRVGSAIPDPNETSKPSSSSSTPTKNEPAKSLKILGGKIVGYNESYGFYDHSIVEATTSDFAPLNGKPGFIINKDGKTEWKPIDTKTFDKAELDRLTADYARRRGTEQIKKDMDASNNAKAEQEARRRQQQASAAGQGKPSGGTPPAGQGKPSGGTPPATSGSGGTPPATSGSGGTPPAGQGKPSGGTPPVGKGEVQAVTLQRSLRSTTPMQQWAAANPRLAAVQAEKERIRGTAQTDNPLMKNFRSRLPVTPTVQSPELAKAVGKTSGYQSLLQNPYVGRDSIASPVTTGRQSPTPVPTQRTVTTPIVARQQAPTPVQRTITTPVIAGRQTPAAPTLRPGPAATPIRPIVPTTTQPIRSTSVTGKQNPIQSTANKMPQGGKQRSALISHYEYEPYDIILEYLVSRGHADTLNEANYLMLEMDQESIQNIMEEYENYLLSEEISDWTNELVLEGYDLSDYSWEDLVEYYLLEKFGTAKGRKKLAKKVQAGKDIGKRGSGFEAIVKKASPKYGKERATKIAAAAMWKTYGK